MGFGEIFSAMLRRSKSCHNTSHAGASAERGHCQLMRAMAIYAARLIQPRNPMGGPPPRNRSPSTGIDESWHFSSYGLARLATLRKQSTCIYVSVERWQKTAPKVAVFGVPSTT